MTNRDWDSRYAEGFMPWDTDEPDPNLVAFVQDRGLAPGRALDVGCGTGTHSLWLASLGWDVLGVDVAPRAIELATAKAAKAEQLAGRCEFRVLDFLAEAPPGGPFDFVFDRGCMHVFDAHDDRARFATRVAECLAPDGQWLSLIGSTEGPPRDHGPPRRTARDVANAIEPALEIVELRAIMFDGEPSEAPRAWFCLSRHRAVPAQPSTVQTLSDTR